MVPMDRRPDQLDALDEANIRALAKLAQAVAARLRQRGFGESEIQNFVSRVTTRQPYANLAE